MRRLCAGTWAGPRDCPHHAGEASLSFEPEVGSSASSLQGVDAGPLGGAAEAYAQAGLGCIESAAAITPPGDSRI
jgi:hypothetical protein